MLCGEGAAISSLVNDTDTGLDGFLSARTSKLSGSRWTCSGDLGRGDWDVLLLREGASFSKGDSTS